MHDATETRDAIVFDRVTKSYRLGGGPRERLLDAFGLGSRAGTAHNAFMALDDVSFRLSRGRRMGLVGRNGAGKTTLLKLISGNFRPTSGHVEVNGSVQALMSLGQGFHPDYTGRENIEASLHYNGLSRTEFRAAFEDVVEFCELGQFLDQPLRTYSSGMQSRLMFATGTAIRPDILIIDEIMGAGDAYFLAKSKQRVDQIIGNGCTMLLVSHSMQQVLELCDEVIWMDGGRVVMEGEAFRVVKAYEEALYGAQPGSGDPAATRRNAFVAPAAEAASTSEDGGLAPDPGLPAAEPESRAARTVNLQTPRFMPHEHPAALPSVPDETARAFTNLARDGLSRWEGVAGTKIVGFQIGGPDGPTDRLVALQPARFTIFLQSEVEGPVSYTYGLAIHDLQGRAICRLFSHPDAFTAGVGVGRRVEIDLNPNQIGPGVYTIGISIHRGSRIEDVAFVERYDLLSRSFEITVELPDSLSSASAQFFHSCEWSFAPAALPAVAEATEAEAVP